METEMGDMPDLPVDGGVEIGDAPDLPVDGGVELSESSSAATGDIAQATEQSDLVDGSAEDDITADVDGDVASAAGGEDNTDAGAVKALEQRVEALKAETYAREADELASTRANNESSSTTTAEAVPEIQAPEQPTTADNLKTIHPRPESVEKRPEFEPNPENAPVTIREPEGHTPLEGQKPQTKEGGDQGKEGETVENEHANKSPEGSNPPPEWRPGKEG